MFYIISLFSSIYYYIFSFIKRTHLSTKKLLYLRVFPTSGSSLFQTEMGTASNVLYYIFSNFHQISIEHVFCAVYYVNSLVKMYVISVAINWVYILYKELIHFYITM
jgi:hypothetical protein